MKKYRVGIIGYGGFGKFLHQWWEKMDQVRVVAIADSKVELHEVASCQVYRHWEELLASDQVDIVSIVTPPSVHAEIAIAAMLAGKHVMLEKPVAISLEQADAILKTQQQTGMRIMVNHMLRYNPILREMAKLSLGGSLGKLRQAEVSNYAQDSSLPADHWFWNRDFSGGIMVEHGVHFFDVINSLTTQKVQRVTGLSSFRNPAQQDQVSATVQYDGGLIAQHYHSFSGPGFFEQTTIRLHFDLARVEINGWIPMSGSLTALVEGASGELLDALPGWELADVQAFGDADREERIFAGGIGYSVDHIITGRFKLPTAKSEIYGKCVQDILADLICLIEDPGHRPQVTVQDAVASLAIALQASE